MTTLDKFHAVRNDLNNAITERQQAIDNALLALASGHHFLMLGPTGTAKSLLVNELCKRIDGAQQFVTLLTAFSTPEEVFGPIDLIGMADRGEYKRLGVGMLQSAHIAMLDEIFKANSAILNSLLWILNERQMFEPGMAGPQPVPLLTLFAASNETPQDDSLAALNDRFVLRQIIDYVQDDTAFLQMMTHKPIDPQAFITLDDINTARLEAADVKGTPEALQAVLQIKHQLSAKGLSVSDRKWRQALDVIKASAWLDGSAETQLDNVCCLTSVLWTDPQERRQVEQVVYQNVSPITAEAIETEDLATELAKELPPENTPDERDRLENILQQLDNMLEDLQRKLERSGVSSARAEQALDRIASLHNNAATRYRAFVRRLGIRAASGEDF